MTTVHIGPKQPSLRIEILPELRDRLPTLSNHELDELDQALVTEGCVEPLTLWGFDSRYFVLDGHHRLALCTAHGIPFNAYILTADEIPDLDAALDWVDRRQLARRNLPADQFKLILGRRYLRQKKNQGGRSDRDLSGGHDGQPKKTTAERLAQEHNVSERSVRRAGEFAAAVEAAKAKDPAIEQKVLRGEVTRKAVIKKAKPPAAAVVAVALDGDGRDIPEDLRSVFEERGHFATVARELSRVKQYVHERIQTNPLAWSNFPHQKFDAAISDLRHITLQSQPALMCSVCGGVNSSNCRQCGGRRFLSLHQGITVPKEFRNTVRMANGLPPIKPGTQR